ncbi:hypothetical protein DH96_00745 [Candidatus Phytoplasma oryzae]|uniref:Uncharacterized protein n=1 Tax=Candidatus Phytoplasma oryzae TaxID=203274 RepID=A0A328IHW7_9MOLU|nr:hypothetical protein DH96_00745 [Candidatus Phytoplasma oryzae]
MNLYPLFFISIFHKFYKNRKLNILDFEDISNINIIIFFFKIKTINFDNIQKNYKFILFFKYFSIIL